MSYFLVQLSNLYKSFGSQKLFEDVSLSINLGETFALIGENGSGKTTLLRLLAGLISPDRGRLQHAPDLSIGLLPQEIELEKPGITAREYIESNRLHELEKLMATCLEDPNRLSEWEKLHEEYEKKGGYQKLPLEKVLHGLKLETALDTPMNTLSSGQRVRIALAKLLVEDPDLLLLDEPTNHLDQAMIDWLKETLQIRKGATIIVSHDRKFLNETCNHLIEIDESKLSCYGGSYDYYLQERENRLERKMKAYEGQQKERAELKQKIRAITFSKPKARPASDRNKMAYDSRGEHHQRSIQSTLDSLKTRLHELENHLLPHPKPKTITGLRFIPTELSSAVALEFDEVAKSFGDKPLFSSFSKSLRKSDRIILKGPNGSGKTTLLRLAAGLLPPDKGTIRMAPTAKVAFLDQEVEMLPMEKMPLEHFKEAYNLNEENLRKELHKAALGSSDLLKQSFSKMSVGQRKRFMLLSLILEKPNVLLLDEPTNHLDFLSLEALEKALLHFEGAILAVSHDLTFIEKVATGVWEIQPVE